MKEISENGVAFITRWEGIRRRVYTDQGGYPTIGIGHLLTRSELHSGKLVIAGEIVRIASGLTIDQCYALLREDLKQPVYTVNQSVLVELTQGQFDALVSFTFNVGDSAFQNSTLLRVLNAGRYNLVPEQLLRWIYTNGIKSDGLLNRRRAEAALWNGEEQPIRSMLGVIGAHVVQPPDKKWWRLWS